MATIRELIYRELYISNKRKELEQNLKAYTVYLAGCKANSELALRDGDITKEAEWKAKTEESKKQISSIQDELSHLDQPDPEGLKREWRNASISYSRSFGAKLDAYLAARDALGKQFKELVYMQREMLEERNELLMAIPEEMKEQVGTPKTMDVPVFDQRARYNGFLTTTDIAFFASCGAISPNMIPGATSVIIRKEPVSETFLNLGYNSLPPISIVPTSIPK